MISYKRRKRYKYTLEESYSCHTGMHVTKVEDLGFLRGDTSGRLFIKKGYVWDGPSGPSLDTRNFMRASLVHDALYQLMREGKLRRERRREADQIMRRICIESGMPRLCACLAHWGVRLGGCRRRTASWIHRSTPAAPSHGAPGQPHLAMRPGIRPSGGSSRPNQPASAFLRCCVVLSPCGWILSPSTALAERATRSASWPSIQAPQSFRDPSPPTTAHSVMNMMSTSLRRLFSRRGSGSERCMKSGVHDMYLRSLAVMLFRHQICPIMLTQSISYLLT